MAEGKLQHSRLLLMCTHVPTSRQHQGEYTDALGQLRKHADDSVGADFSTANILWMGDDDVGWPYSGEESVVAREVSDYSHKTHVLQVCLDSMNLKPPTECTYKTTRIVEKYRDHAFCSAPIRRNGVLNA